MSTNSFSGKPCCSSKWNRFGEVTRCCVNRMAQGSEGLDKYFEEGHVVRICEVDPQTNVGTETQTRVCVSYRSTSTSEPRLRSDCSAASIMVTMRKPALPSVSGRVPFSTQSTK